MAYVIFDSIGGKLMGGTGQTAFASGGQNIEETSTVQRLATGSRVRAIDPTYGEAEFIYAKGVASTVVGDLCVLNGDGTTARVAAARTKGRLGVAMSANVANQWGWYAVYGTVPVKAATVVANAQVYLTATAGTVDDAIVAGDFVVGAMFATADGTPSAGLAMITLSYPASTDADNA
jgi:hypothetical protein